MLWIHQRPFDGGDWPDARLHVEIVTPWRAPGVARYVAAGELGSGVYFNPVVPEEAARALREAAEDPRGPAVGAAGADEPGPRAAVGARSTAPAGVAQRAVGLRAAAAPRGGRGRVDDDRGAGPVDDAGLRAGRSTRTCRCRSTNSRRPCRSENPTGVYRRRFARRAAGERVVLHFGGSEGALFVELNGEPVGIAQGLADARRVRRHRPARGRQRARRARSSSGRTRASSRTRTSGGTAGCPATSSSTPRRANTSPTSSRAATPTGGSCSTSRPAGAARLVDAGGATVLDEAVAGASKRASTRRPLVGRDANLYTLHVTAGERRGLVPGRLPHASRSPIGSCSSTAGPSASAASTATTTTTAAAAP